MTFSRAVRILSVCLLALLSAAHATAGSLNLAWDVSSEPDVAGYTLAYGTQSGKYTGWIDVGNSTSYTVTLADGNYYFAVRAYTHDGEISSFSNEVLASVGIPGSGVSGTCATSDPFLSLGGGTCYLGGWLPPGMAPTGSGITQPAPAPAPAPAPSSSTGCTTSDPFAAMGGGTCYNGGWLPPGMAVPGGGTSAPAPAPAPAPSPAPAPAPSTSVNCTTADPFASMGGGTCYNGGWLPPGMAVPGGGTSAPAPAPAPAPSPAPAPAPSTSVNCTTADPFASMGGGTCYNGGWLPPGMAVPGGGTAPAPSPTAPAPAPAPGPSTPAGCSTTDPFASMGGGTCYKGGWLPPGMTITATGTLSVLSLQDELWLIHGEDGTIYASPTDVSPLLLVDGARVTFQGVLLPTSSGATDVVIVNILAFEVHQ